MKSVGNYNKISPELQKLIPKLEKGKTVVFKMLNGVKNNDPDNMQRQKNPMFYPKSNIYLKDRIWDEFAKNASGEVVGEWVDIIVADGWEKGEPTRMHLYFPFEHGTVFTGKFSFTGGNNLDEQIYEHIMLCNLNRDAVTGKHRDTSVNPMFGMVSLANDMKVTTNKRDNLIKALNLSKEMTPADARELGRSLNWNEYTDDNELMMKVEDFAREKPEDFLKTFNNPSKGIKSILKEALDLEIASYDVQLGILKVGEQLVTTLPTKDRPNYMEPLATWFAEAPNGAAVLENIKKQLKEKKEPVTA